MLQQLKLFSDQILTELGIEKYCPRCDEYWPLDREFWQRNKSHPDGYAVWCKSCRLEYDRRRYIKKHPNASLRQLRK